ncbi:hypothetical protein [Pseudogulbenkiania subflava]|uniref:Molecular chaperone n=1 Tax=Pseudogulbenkiania subflava DSM 22618 TaxID=1123014 RepID=A0A1Y6CF95_9NEIS|nr:hypothetical protein [Pseudogulbenkiania subflava]SMF52044.1 hypothetical protein SAMN02745746_03738 [Pseudogulbenkiania subflava DSM 22618]
MQLRLPDNLMDPKLVDLQPDSVADWLDRLPYTRLDECGHLLLGALQSLSRTQVAVGTRHKLLKLYLAALDRFFPALETQIVSDEVVSSSKARQAARLGMALFDALFAGFKRTLVERLEKRSLLEREQPKVELLCLALLTARMQVKLAMECYSDLPLHFWHDCHQLYQLAEESGWQERRHAPAETIAVVYRQILLMGLTDSKHLGDNEIAAAKGLIFRLAPRIGLIALAGLTKTQGFGYQVDPARDDPPHFLPLKPQVAASGEFWVYLNDVIDALQQPDALARQLANEAAIPAELTVEVARKLAEEWAQPRRRRQPRQPVQQWLSLTAQLLPIWLTLRPAPVEPIDDSPIPVLGRPAPPALFQAVNQSQLGFLLRGNPQEQPLRTGELLLLAPQLQPDNRLLCAVRWAAAPLGGNDVECGVELLGPAPEAVEVLPTITYQDDVFQPALHLAAQPRLGRPALLVMPGRPFSRLREFVLRDSHGETRIRVTRVELQTPFYQAMEYRRSVDL